MVLLLFKWKEVTMGVVKCNFWALPLLLSVGCSSCDSSGLVLGKKKEPALVHVLWKEPT